nr:unnamed protein product [Callosobruchus analis]
MVAKNVKGIRKLGKTIKGKPRVLKVRPTFLHPAEPLHQKPPVLHVDASRNAQRGLPLKKKTC